MSELIYSISTYDAQSDTQRNAKVTKLENGAYRVVVFAGCADGMEHRLQLRYTDIEEAVRACIVYGLYCERLP